MSCARELLRRRGWCKLHERWLHWSVCSALNERFVVMTSRQLPPASNSWTIKNLRGECWTGDTVRADLWQHGMQATRNCSLYSRQLRTVCNFTRLSLLPHMPCARSRAMVK